MEIIYRAFGLTDVELLRKAPGGGFTGLLCAYESNADGEIIARGAFSKTTQEHGSFELYALPEELDEKPIGHISLLGCADGLRVKGQFKLAKSRGALAYRLLSSGALNEITLRYSVINSGTKTEAGKVTEVRLFGAAVKVPAHGSAWMARLPSEVVDFYSSLLE